MPDGSTPKPTTAPPPLWEVHKTIHPKAVSGYFRRLKWAVLAVLLGIFFVTPWLRWDRGADAPGQAVLFDLTQGRFFIFGIEIWPQEIYYLTGILIVAAVGLFLATALAGRVWCGFGCPHTVWTDLFIRIEHFFEGDRAERIRMERAPWTAKKIGRKAGKHAFWLLVSAVSAFGFCAYFTDAPQLATDIATLNVSSDALTFLGLFMFSTYGMAGWAREQMCYYMCPWPRIQTAMLDEHSLVVTYQAERGDSRGPKRKSETWEERAARGLGDCIDCGQCVQVCPMGIDVRSGEQADCINCGLCVDACDSIMMQVGRPLGLIKFDTLANLAAPAPAKAAYKVPVMRARTMIYLGVMGVVLTLMTVVFTNRSHTDVAVLRDRAPLFVTLSDGSIRNGYTFKVANKSREDRVYDLAVKGLPGAEVNVIGEGEGEHEQAGGMHIKAAPDSVATYRVYVKAPRASVTAASTPLTFTLSETGGREKDSYTSVFLGPN
ncbi:cytochrome c oxidase accessory protein CcoG [Azospirillum sp.]|uniref:cytochrome c oxidase accessory protein CcoG n=1 Tax=Azospirillum sp. TaxID=34012 RepID=UPI002D56F8B5|nr:cytochrome c oxidase accessory protein CcoG [Azospirillum sp.]HYD67215.1 cytochrome c oxidase accessory protein CcoG [Azospirillum sp.]